jgi:hypothetical protein
VRGQRQWGMTPRPIKQFIRAVSGDVGTFRKRGEERMKTAIEMNGYETVKPLSYFLK